MTYSAIGALAVLILVIENHDVLWDTNKAFQAPAWRAYRRFLWAVLAYCATDILWGMLEARKLAGPLFADTAVYFVAMAAGILCWTRYTVKYLEENSGFGRFLVTAGYIVAAAVALLSLVNIFTPVLYTVDENSVYTGLPARYAMLGAQILLLLAASVYAFTARRHQEMDSEKRKKYRTLGLFGLIMALFLTIQLWYPYLPLYAIAYLLGTCLLHSFVIGDEKEKYRTELQEAERIAALKQSITSLLDNMPGMTFSKDAKTGVYLACNQAFADYARKPDPQGVAGLTDHEIFDKVTADHFVEDDRMALSMAMPYVFFEDVSDAQGNPRQLQTTKLKFVDGDGRLCILGMCQDVTDMVRIQRESATTKEAYQKARSIGIMYAHIAQALSRSYDDLFYVNLDTEEYIHYHNNEEKGTLEETERGWHYFEVIREKAQEMIHADDRDAFIRAMDRNTLLAALKKNNTFLMTFRLLREGKSAYVTMKVCRMEDDDRFITIGLSDVDDQVKHQKAAERMEEERIAYARLNTLTGDFLCIYIVVPETGRYREYSASEGYASFSVPKEGMDFFAESRANAKGVVYEEDLDRFLEAFTRERVRAEIEKNGIFAISYRLMIDGKPKYVRLKAAMVDEKEGRRMVVGVNDIDAHVRQEQEFASRLAKARSEANIDALTGVKNRHAYMDAEDRLNRQIESGDAPEFAIVMLDVNDLKKVNDTQGHQAGDAYLQNACTVICDIFQHSPVFRVGGDEFAVIARERDYQNIDALVAQVDHHNDKAIRDGGIVIACGMSRFHDDESAALPYARADQTMYENKRLLKERQAAAGKENEQ